MGGLTKMLDYQIPQDRIRRQKEFYAIDRLERLCNIYVSTPDEEDSLEVLKDISSLMYQIDMPDAIPVLKENLDQRRSKIERITKMRFKNIVFEQLRECCKGYASTYSKYHQIGLAVQIKAMMEELKLEDCYDGLIDSLNEQRKREAA